VIKPPVHHMTANQADLQCACGFVIGFAPDTWSDDLADVTCQACRAKVTGTDPDAKLTRIREWAKGRKSDPTVIAHARDSGTGGAYFSGYLFALRELEELL
jgi:hypothetical protein